MSHEVVLHVIDASPALIAMITVVVHAVLSARRDRKLERTSLATKLDVRAALNELLHLKGKTKLPD